jgi:hypothetical protein
MRTPSLLLAGMILALTFQPSRGATAEQDIASRCRAISTAAVQASHLRDAGITAQEATKKLTGKFSEEEIEAGVNTAFAYPQLKEFALFDLTTTYCTKMLPANGKPSDFTKLWVRTHYERAMECSSQGQFEREAFQKCWDMQKERDKKGIEKIVLMIMNFELILAELKTCETRFPEYTAQNREAFSKSDLSKVSSELIIDKYAKIGAKQTLLKGLEDLRARPSPYATMAADKLEKRCSSFPQTKELQSAK